MKRAFSINRHLVQRAGFTAITIMAFATVIPIIAVVIYILVQGLPAISLEFLTGFPHDGMRAGGILPAIIGTLYLTIGTAIFSVPLGIAAAIYLAEYASDTPLTRTIRIAIINLAGIPSVVYGLFGLGLFVIFLNFGTSILAASQTLSIMTLPVIISTAEEALRSVPQQFRTVSISLGATRWQTIRRIVLKGRCPVFDRRHPRAGTCRGRNCPDPLHGCGILPAAFTPLPFRCHHGIALSPFRDLHAGP
jgi:phosphate transport system permease protein